MSDESPIRKKEMRFTYGINIIILYISITFFVMSFLRLLRSYFYTHIKNAVQRKTLHAHLAFHSRGTEIIIIAYEDSRIVFQSKINESLYLIRHVSLGAYHHGMNNTVFFSI